GFHAPQSTDCGTQSATHSNRLPTMSNAPRADTQALREPVGVGSNAFAVLQSARPSSGPGSGVPATATCHSAFVGSRLPAFVQACCAWNHVAQPDGRMPGKLTAKTSSTHDWPSSVHGA